MCDFYNKINSKFLWLVVSIPSILSLSMILINPSSAENAWIMGLSKQRLLVLLIPALCILFCFILFFLHFAASEIYKKLSLHFRRFYSAYGLLSGILSFWVFTFLFVFLFVYQFFIKTNIGSLTQSLGALVPNLCAYIDRLWAILILIAF